MADLSRYEIEQTIQIFQNDQEFQKIVVTDGKINLIDQQYRELAETLLEEQSHISDNDIDTLNSEEPPFLRDEIANIYNKDYIEKDIYYQTMYTFKYATVKTFFRDNYIKFMPDFDYLTLQSNEKMKVFQEAFMREYDRFAAIIDSMYNIVDVDRVPDEYLNYLAQAVGYEREDSKLLYDASFRELIKNIIEIYGIKGTNYSFELFFNFLGFEATIKEFWFDKRYGDPNISSNPNTGATDKDDASFYLSETKPTEYIPEGMRNPYIVSANEIIGTLDCNEFGRLAKNGFYTYQQLLGDATGFPDTAYTFFKTNIMEYSLVNIKTEETEEELSSEDLEIIRRYANFLTPIFISKNIIVKLNPFEDDGTENLTLKDADRPDPRSSNPLNTDEIPSNNVRDESMFHLYEGYQPTDYYWEDGTRLYEDPIPPYYADRERWSGKSLEPGGHFISGNYTDTYEKIWDRTDGSGSIYDQISNTNPLWTSEEILSYISNLLHTRQLFSKWNGTTNLYYDVADRDLIPPYLEGNFYYPAVSFNFRDVFSVGTPLMMSNNFSFNDGAKLRFSENQNFMEYPNNYNGSKILSIDADNGSGKAEVKINDSKRRFQFFENLALGTQINTLHGTFTEDSKWVTDIEYSTAVAPEWVPATSYVVGDFVRVPSEDNVFECIQDNTGEPLSNGAYWASVRGIDLVSQYWKIYRPKELELFEIVSIDATNKRVKLDRESTITSTDLEFTIYDYPFIYITIKDTKNFNNEGNYKIESVSTNEISQVIGSRTAYTFETTITLNTTLSTDQNYSLGFVQLYDEPWKMMDFRFPFMFNRVFMEREIKGDSLTTYTDQLMELQEGDYSDESSTLFLRNPNPFGTVGENYSDYPKGGEPEDIELVGGTYKGVSEIYPYSYTDHYLAMITAYERLLEEDQWEYENTFYRTNDQMFEIAGLYTTTEGWNRSSYKFLNEENKYFLDYLEIQIT